RSPVGGGCPILNTAIDADDGNPVLRARVAKALRSWVARLQVIVEQAQERGETRHGVDPKAVATLIVASLEGALMMSRLQRNDDALRRVQRHLNHILGAAVALWVKCSRRHRAERVYFWTIWKSASDSRQALTASKHRGSKSSPPSLTHSRFISARRPRSEASSKDWQPAAGTPQQWLCGSLSRVVCH